MLTVRNLSAFYGGVTALRDVSLDIAPGELLAVLGRNGAGRSTLAQAIMGLVTRRGSVRWHHPSESSPQGVELVDLPSHRIARLGIAYVPATRDVFPTLSVQQNLLLGLQRARAGQRTCEDMYALFPGLAARRGVSAGALSGGEQQMLSLARALMSAPRLLVIDEPTEGLAASMVDRVAETLAALKSQGVAIALIDQRLALAERLADRCLVLGRGAVVFEGSVPALRRDAAVCREWLDL